MEEGWLCVEGCPVLELGRQSGVSTTSKPGTVRRNKPTAPNAMAGSHGVLERTEPAYGDTGTAARFFMQFGEDNLIEPVQEVSSVQVINDDCLAAMRRMPESSIDSIVCDPPYDLTNRVPDVKKCRDCGRILGGMDGKPDACPRCGGELYNQRSQHNGKGGFMGKEWDSTGVAFDPNTWVEALRVLRPGGFLLAFGGTRTVHRLACAIEDAGFEIRDRYLNIGGDATESIPGEIAWVYGSG